jgi:hypothetical protein
MGLSRANFGQFFKELGTDVAKTTIDTLINKTGLKKETEKGIGNLLGKYKIPLIIAGVLVIVVPTFFAIVNFFMNKKRR